MCTSTQNTQVLAVRGARGSTQYAFTHALPSPGQLCASSSTSAHSSNARAYLSLHPGSRAHAHAAPTSCMSEPPGPCPLHEFILRPPLRCPAPEPPPLPSNLLTRFTWIAQACLCPNATDTAAPPRFTTPCPPTNKTTSATHLIVEIWRQRAGINRGLCVSRLGSRALGYYRREAIGAAGAVAQLTELVAAPALERAAILLMHSSALALLLMPPGTGFFGRSSVRVPRTRKPSHHTGALVSREAGESGHTPLSHTLPSTPQPCASSSTPAHSSTTRKSLSPCTPRPPSPCPHSNHILYDCPLNPRLLHGSTMRPLPPLPCTRPLPSTLDRVEPFYQDGARENVSQSKRHGRTAQVHDDLPPPTRAHQPLSRSQRSGASVQASR